jgi:hypothetical protein
LVAADYQEIAALRQLCMRYQCTGILVHHMKKGKSQYTSDQILGTTGVSAAVDGWWAIADDPHNPRCKIIDVRGRSIPETVLRIGFNPKAKHPGVYIVDQGIEAKQSSCLIQSNRNLRRFDERAKKLPNKSTVMRVGYLV